MRTYIRGLAIVLEMRRGIDRGDILKLNFPRPVKYIFEGKRQKKEKRVK